MHKASLKCNLTMPYSFFTPYSLQNICDIVSECCALTYFKWTQLGIASHITAMSLVGSIFFTLVVLADYANIYKHRTKDKKQKNSAVPIQDVAHMPNTRRPIHDVDVQTERDRVATLRCHDLRRHLLVVCHLSKIFGACAPHAAVKRVSFVVDHSQCFGVVGKHGAGKSSLLQTLAGATTISGGNAWVQSFNVRTRVKEVNRRIGYCPQSDGLIDEMTGRETIEMHCALRGISTDEETERVIDNLAQELGFFRQLDVPSKKCNGCTKRKFSTAVALCGDPAVVYLDEPSNRMDASARRCLWNTLTKVRRMGKAIVLSSDNMTECEILCTKVAIMVAGKFRCLGTIQHLKSRFGKDYTLIVTVKRMADCATETTAAEMKPVDATDKTETMTRNEKRNSLDRKNQKRYVHISLNIVFPN